MASGNHQDTSEKPSGKKAKKLSQKEQSERFIETVRELGIEESDERFELVAQSILSRPHKKNP